MLHLSVIWNNPAYPRRRYVINRVIQKELRLYTTSETNKFFIGIGMWIYKLRAYIEQLNMLTRSNVQLMLA